MGSHLSPIVRLPRGQPFKHGTANTRPPSERKIDLIEERLDGIEDALWAIAAGGTIIGSNRVSQRSAAPSTASRSLRSIHPQAAQTEVEDEDKDESDSVVGVD